MLSIIVPVYNTENHIEETLNSLLKQTYEDVEILLINDGSTDKSGEICEKFCSEHSQFKVYHKTNGGVSSARNFGLDMCSGEYIAFVDSDDLVEPAMFDHLMAEAKKGNCDIVQCDFVRGLNTKLDLTHSLPEKELTAGVEIAKHLFEPQKLIFNSVWAKVFKRELLSDIRFDEKIRIAEDLLFTYLCCLKANKVKIIPYKGYIYTDREGSAMNSPFSTKRFDNFKVNDLMLNHVESNNEMIRRIRRRDARVAFECYYSATVEKKISEHRTFLIERLKKSNGRYSLGAKLEISIFMILHFHFLFEKYAKIWYKFKHSKPF